RWHYIFGYVQLDMIKRKLCDFLTGRSQRTTVANRIKDDPVQYVRIQYHVVPLLSAKHITGRGRGVSVRQALETLFEATRARRAHKKIEHEDRVIDRKAR